MVGKKSEYQKQFATSILTNHIPIYEANLECRYKRRDQQFSHTSIAWGSTDSSSEDEAETKLKNLKLNEKNEPKAPQCPPKDASPDKKSKKADIGVNADLSNEEINLVGTQTIVKPDMAKVEKLDFGETQVLSPGKKKRIKRPDRKEKIPKARPSTASSQRPNSASIEELEGRIPFLSYGAGDGDKYSGILWTHNVKVDKDVYPSALRAKKNRELQQQKKEEKQNKYVWLNERKKNAILKLMKKETADWETEYQKHYPAYDKIIYEKSLLSRPPSARPEY